MDKVRVIERSLRCFVMGCFSLIPLLGVIPAIVTLVTSHKVRQEARGHWNPAGRHLVFGELLAWIGLGLTLSAVGLRLARVLF